MKVGDRVQIRAQPPYQPGPHENRVGTIQRVHPTRKPTAITVRFDPHTCQLCGHPSDLGVAVVTAGIVHPTQLTLQPCG